MKNTIKTKAKKITRKAASKGKSMMGSKLGTKSQVGIGIAVLGGAAIGGYYLWKNRERLQATFKNSNLGKKSAAALEKVSDVSHTVFANAKAAKDSIEKGTH